MNRRSNAVAIDVLGDLLTHFCAQFDRHADYLTRVQQSELLKCTVDEWERILALDKDRIIALELAIKALRANGE